MLPSNSNDIGEEDSYEMIHKRNNGGAEKGTTTIVGSGRMGSLNDSQEDILPAKRRDDDVYVTKTVDVYRQ